MFLTDICIRRPVFATVMNLMLILLGLIALNRLSIREYPKIDEPVITITTHYQGASAEIIESQVTKPLEDSLAGIEGIAVMNSISRQENSQISVRFKISRDPDAAAADVRDRVGRIRGKLPDAVDEPIIAKTEADAQPMLYIAFFSDRHSSLEISDIADRYVKDRLQSIVGVANVLIFGEKRISLRLWLQPERLAAYQLTPQDIENALRQQNVEIPAGRVESKTREFTVLAQSDLRTPEQFNNLVVKQTGDAIVRFSDIGRAEIAPVEVRLTSRFNGEEALVLGVVKQSVANPLDISQEVRKILPKIQASLPEGMKLNVAYDSSVFIEYSIYAVYSTIFEAIVLVLLVIFFFLRSLRSTFIPLVTIPVSLIGTMMIMYVFDFSINTLTLLAFVLAVGLVVDDAIVMLENIYRYMEEGLAASAAALKGSREIAFAIVAMTLTLIAVYTPIAFIEGRTGKLFTEFALTLAGAVLISGFIALTLSPMMCAKLLKKQEHHHWLYELIENLLNGLQRGYLRLLDWALKHSKTMIAVGLLVALSGLFLLQHLPAELAPIEDRSTIVSVGVGPEGASVDYMAQAMQQIENIFKSVPEIEKYFVIAGFPVVNQGIAFARLSTWEERTRKQQDIVTELQPKLFAAIPGIMSFPINPPSLGRSPIEKPVNFVIQTSGSYEELNTVVDQIMAKTRQIPGLVSLDSDLKLNKPQLAVTINRDKAAAVGVKIDDIGRTLETMLGGRQVTRFKKDGEEYDVIVQIEDDKRSKPTDISDIYVRGDHQQMINLANLISLEENVAPRELNHFNQLRSASITGNIAPGYTLGQALDILDSTAQSILPNSMQIDYDGESREFRESSTSLIVTFILALCFIYLVLSAQFESFISPFIIMLTVPLSMAGALLALTLIGGSLNIYSEIGLITLIGLITKHGILIVSFANQLQIAGSSVLAATREACRLRLRPILMTTGAMVLGAIPLALAFGASAESRQQMGWVIIGGLMVGTLFTLFVIPVIYTLVYSRHKLSAAEQQIEHLT